MLTDKYKIDSHKLIYHVGRVNDWLKEKRVFPIYMEISPIGACNHRCSFCGLDFMGYQKRILDFKILKERIRELGRLGIKSIMYGGEGEPLLHGSIAEIIKQTEQNGIDAAVTTNGVFLKPELTQEILARIKWIKFSIDAGTPETYRALRKAGKEDFSKVIDNAAYAVKYKEKNKLNCTIGTQMILLPENQREAEKLAKISRDIGVDYLVIKPYSQHPQSRTRKYENIRYSDYLNLADRLLSYNTDCFSVIFRINTIKKWNDSSRNYLKCWALPFWSYIDSGGRVWGCSIYLEDERFYYGNIYRQAFRQIWTGKRRKKVLNFAEKKLDISHCRINCRMDEINRYLWELKHPPKHVNFI